MNEIKEILEGDFDEYGKGLDSSEQDQLDAEEMMAQNDIPLPEPGMGGIYELFGKVMSQQDTLRICNLSKEEMGMLPFTVRGSIYVSQLAYSFNHIVFGNFFLRNAEIIQESSLSKDGFLISTFVTSKRYATNKNEQRQEPQLNQEPKKKKPWKGIFSK